MNPRKNLAPEIADLWQRLEGARGPKYWRSLEELADTDAFRELMRREFPEQASAWPDRLSRRAFLSLMGASLALAGLSGCSVRPAPSTEIVPYVRAPEELVPGKPLFYATAMTLGGTGVGLLVESHMGRPTKVEGNPEHPASLGATDLYHQASVLTLYDPDRSQNVTRLRDTVTWDDVRNTLRDALVDPQTRRPRRSAKLRLLTETVVSPTLADQIRALLKAFPEARWHQYEPLARDAAFRGARAAFGEPVNTVYRFYDLEKKRPKADVILSLDADFLSCGPGNLRYVAEFTAGRRVRTPADDSRQARMNRLYAVEPSVTNTGAKADHRLAMRAGVVEGFARNLAAALKVPGAPEAGDLPEDARDFLGFVADDLLYLDPEPGGRRDRPRPKGTTLVVAGDRQPASVHLLAHAINHHLGNFGSTVLHTDPVEAEPVDHFGSLRQLVEDMENDEVEVLLILGGNPVYNAPADLDFGGALERFSKKAAGAPHRFSGHLSLHQDETSRRCQWNLPEAHYLEAWGDTRAFDGTASVVQPLIQPLYQGRSAVEVLALITSQLQLPGYESPLGYEIVRAYWSKHRAAGGSKSGDFEDFWQTALHDGVIAGTKYLERAGASLAPKEGWAKTLEPRPQPAVLAAEHPELVFQQDPTIYDGRFANNGWLQELPKPITRLTWDNAALMSPATAKRLGVGIGSYAHGGEHGGYHQPVVELQVGDRKVRAPVWIMPGHVDHSITVSLGYGRANAGRVGGGGDKPVGFNAYVFRTSEHPLFNPDLTVARAGGSHLLACVQGHHLMENREPVRSGKLGRYREHPDFAHDKEREDLKDETRTPRTPLPLAKPDEHPNLYGEYPYPNHKWGMAIDLTACVGCGACVVACQAENNIPVVGKEQVAAGREMHWLRIDRYVGGTADRPAEFYFQPVPCMHCENAPCEYVCPVEATVHSADGLNDMIYQRCVGTRFCSNNCPYKVRRFNFFFYADYVTPSVRQQYNPDVTVRSRGVMEKCSYCVQRIRHADINSQIAGRPIFDGEVVTACQAACPAQAILFGDLNDPKSKVRAWKETPLNYSLLGDLNTHPRTTYLAALRNHNPDMEAR